MPSVPAPSAAHPRKAVLMQQNYLYFPAPERSCSAHITAAIGGAVAASHGASFLCYVTPAEHLRLPDEQDVKEGIIASKIAAHAADIAKGIHGASDWDYAMSTARKRLDWEEMFRLSMDPEKARRYRAEAKPEKEDTCSMCGNFCAVKNMNRILEGEIVSIYDE